MIGEAFAEAAGLLRTRPALWLPGIAAAGAIVLVILLQPFVGAFLSGKIDLVVTLLSPLILGATYEVVRRSGTVPGDTTPPGPEGIFEVQADGPAGTGPACEGILTGAGVADQPSEMALPAGAGAVPGEEMNIDLVPELTTGSSGPAPAENWLSVILNGAARNYFRILIPAILIGCAVLLSAGAVLLTLLVAGFPTGPVLIGMTVLGSAVPILAGTFFFDTAAVLENRGVFESIRRAVEVAVNRPSQLIILLLAILFFLGGICFTLMLIFTALVGDRLLPLTTMAPDAISALTPADFVAMIGPDGLLYATLLAAIGVAVVIPVTLTWKACAFRRIVSAVPATVGGEFDSKGRWYKY